MKLVKIFPLLLSIIFLVACESKSPETVAETYWQAVLAGEEEKARSLTTDPDYSGIEKYIEPGDGSQVEVGETVIERSNAYAATVLTWEDDNGETSTFSFNTQLINTDDGWKIKPEDTRSEFVAAVLKTTMSDLQQAFEESAQEFRRLGQDFLSNLADELDTAGEQLKEDAETASEEINQFLEKLDKELVEKLKEFSADPN